MHVLVVDDWRLRPIFHSLLAPEFAELRVVARREIEGLPERPAETTAIEFEP
jgi:hypothetical protein